MRFILHDFSSGLADLKLQIIRFVGDPEQRIKEDALRMLRAIRFSLKKGWTLDKKAEEAIQKNATSIKKISAERILMEMEKM